MVFPTEHTNPSVRRGKPCMNIGLMFRRMSPREKTSLPPTLQLVSLPVELFLRCCFFYTKLQLPQEGNGLIHSGVLICFAFVGWTQLKFIAGAIFLTCNVAFSPLGFSPLGSCCSKKMKRPYMQQYLPAGLRISNWISTEQSFLRVIDWKRVRLYVTGCRFNIQTLS